MIALIDYGAGNVASVHRAFAHLGAECRLTSDPDSLRKAHAAVLPGVGAFGHAVESLRKSGMDQAIKEFIKNGNFFLGVCLGMQLLFSKSAESQGFDGLSLIEGDVLKFEKFIKVPQVGYNTILKNEKNRLFFGLPNTPYFYFVHSYYCSVTDQDVLCSTADYGVRFDAALEKDNVFAVQFHPEKSGETGLRLLKNFIHIAEER